MCESEITSGNVWHVTTRAKPSISSSLIYWAGRYDLAPQNQTYPIVQATNRYWILCRLSAIACLLRDWGLELVRVISRPTRRLISRLEAWWPTFLEPLARHQSLLSRLIGASDQIQVVMCSAPAGPHSLQVPKDGLGACLYRQLSHRSG